MYKKFTFIILSLFSMGVSHAKFGGDRKSIDFTANTPPEGHGDVGFGSLSYGVNDQFMISIPTLSMLSGYVGLNVKYKVELSPQFSIAPSAGISYAPKTDLDSKIGRGATLVGTIHFNEKNDLSFGVGAASPVLSLNSDNQLKYKAGYGFTGLVTFDHYTDGGNLFYVGVLNTIPILGFTWAWEHVHFGVGLAYILPYLNLYFQF